MVLPVMCFSFLYAALEYYLIVDPSFGMNPMLFSLIYPYHLLMAGLFGLVAYSIVILHLPSRKNKVLILVLGGTIFCAMLVIEDLAWFSFRAVAPREGDINGGKLVIEGEWTTQIMGSTNFYSIVVPNWYFVSASWLIIASLVVAAHRKKQNLLLRETMNTSRSQLQDSA
jgi:hypothetical protein